MKTLQEINKEYWENLATYDRAISVRVITPANIDDILIFAVHRFHTKLEVEIDDMFIILRFKGSCSNLTQKEITSGWVHKMFGITFYKKNK